MSIKSNLDRGFRFQDSGDLKFGVPADEQHFILTALSRFGERTGCYMALRPFSRTMLITDGLGSGETTFALQALVNGAERFDEPGIFVAFEDNSQQVIANAASFDWDLAPSVDAKNNKRSI